MFFVPMVCFVIVFPLTLLVLGPLGLTIGRGLTAVMLGLYKYVGWLAVGLVAACLPLLISIGAHKAFIPYVISSLGELGYEILYNCASLAHNISEGGASLAVAVKTKNPELRSAAAAPAADATAAVNPTKGELFSPVDGEVILVLDSKHSVAVLDATGAEILMHIGMDKRAQRRGL